MNESEHSNRPLTLADYVAILNRRKWVILQAVVVVPVAALLVSLNKPAVYQASADVLLSRQDIGAQLSGIQDPNLSQDPTRLAQTQADLARVPDVAERAVAAAHISGATAGSLLSSSDVSPKSGADLLTFTVRDHEPAAAQRLATAYAQAFTKYRADLDTATIERARAQLRDRLAQLKRAGESDGNLYGSLADKEQQLRTLQLLQTSNTLVRPAEGAVKTEPRPRRNALLGAIFGAVLGLSIAFIWEALDRRVRSPEELEAALRLPVLARLSQPPRRLERKRHLALVYEPRGPDAEAIRRLRTNLEFANLDREARVIMVTSAVQREGKSTTVANLGVALAQSGQRVAIIDLDLRQPSIGRLFGVEGQPGVTDVVRGSHDLEHALVPVVHDSMIEKVAQPTNGHRADGNPLLLQVLSAGLTLPMDPSQFVASGKFAAVLERLRALADIVLVDAPPLLAVGETMMLTTKVDAVLAVARVGTVPRPALREFARALDAVPVTKLGLVITGVSQQATYGYGAYGYYEPPQPVSRSSHG